MKRNGAICSNQSLEPSLLTPINLCKGVSTPANEMLSDPSVSKSKARLQFLQKQKQKQKQNKNTLHDLT